MFENMNLKDKDIELFVNAITEILEFPDEVINEANIEEIERVMTASLSGAEKNQAITETVIKMKAQGYTKEMAYEMIADFENSLKDVVEEVANLTSNPYKIRIINKIFEMLGDIINEAVEKFLGHDTVVYFELIHEGAKLPEYAHETDAGADVFAPEDITIPAYRLGYKAPTGFKMALAPGWEMQVRPRSGLSYKTSLRVSNAPGTIDEGYRDEVGILFDNFSSQDYVIRKGERMAQFVIAPTYKFKAQLTDDVSKIGENRGGGFGSTGA